MSIQQLDVDLVSHVVIRSTEQFIYLVGRLMNRDKKSGPEVGRAASPLLG